MQRQHATHCAHQIGRQTWFGEEGVAAGVLGALTLGAPCACRQHNDGDALRALVCFQLGDELHTVHVAREKNSRDDDVGNRRDTQRVVSSLNGNHPPALTAEKLRIHLSVVAFWLNEQHDEFRRHVDHGAS